MSDAATAGVMDAIWKGLSAGVLAVFAWAWGISRKHDILAEQFRLHETNHASEMRTIKDDLKKINRRIGKVLDHLTGTELHGEED